MSSPRDVAEADQSLRLRPHVVDGSDAGFAKAFGGGIDQVGNQPVDHTAQDLEYQATAREIRICGRHVTVVLQEQRHLEQLLHGNEACAYAVVHIVIVIGNLVGEIRQLRLQAGLSPLNEALAQLAELNCIVVRTVFENPFAAFEAEVQTVEVRIVFLEFIDDAQRLQVVFETAEIHHALVEGILARMAERRVSQIMRETDCFGQHFVEIERARDGARNLRHFERMSQPSPVKISLVVDENLGFVHQPAERRGMDDPVAIALVFRAVRRRRFGVAPASRLFVAGGVRGEFTHARYSVKVASSALCA